MIDTFDHGSLGDGDGLIDHMTQENIIMDNFTDDADLGTGAFDLNNDSLMSDNTHLSENGIVDFPPSEIGIGDLNDSGYIHQIHNNTCAVVSQEMVLNDFGVVDPSTGMPFSEAQLVSDANSHGWLTENGTNPADVGDLLELHGIDTHQGHGVENMMGELAQGHKVIVGVDSGELWGKDSIFEDLFSGEHADHAIVVQGMKEDDAGNIDVIVNDPGDPLGAGREYPMDDFVDAFEDGGYYYVATDNAPPDFDPMGSDVLQQYTGDTIASNGNLGEMNHQVSEIDTASPEHFPENMTEQEKDDILLGLNSSEIRVIARGVAHTIGRL